MFFEEVFVAVLIPSRSHDLILSSTKNTIGHVRPC